MASLPQIVARTARTSLCRHNLTRMVTTSQHTRAALYSTYTYSSKTSTTSGTSNDAKSSSSSAVAKAPFPPTSNSVLANNNNGTTTEGLINDPSGDWARSFHGLSVEPFPKDVADVLLAPIATQDVEIKPDGMLYLPEIKYRRILNRAFGPGGWGLAPRGEHSVSPRTISREYALVCHGRFVAQARGEQDYFDPDGLATAAEGCKSNALMRCCKDLGIASELWDPTFIRQFKQEHCAEVMTEHISTKKRRKLWRRKTAQFDYPYKEIK